jgi:hypothetical protein
MPEGRKDATEDRAADADRDDRDEDDVDEVAEDDEEPRRGGAADGDRGGRHERRLRGSPGVAR